MSFGPTTFFGGVTAIGQGAIKVNQDGYVLQSGVIRPDVLNKLIINQVNYVEYLKMLDAVGGSRTVSQTEYNHFEQPYWNKSFLITAAAADGGNPLTSSALLTTNIATNSGTGLGFLQVGDTIQAQNSMIGIVSAVGAAGGFQTVTVQSNNTGTIASGGSVIVGAGGMVAAVGTGLTVAAVRSSNAQPEGGQVNKSILTVPTVYTNYLQTITTKKDLTGEMLRSKTYFGEGDGVNYWAASQDIQALREHYTAIDQALLFGKKNSESSTGPRTTEGYVQTVLRSGTSYSAGSTILESDMKNLIVALQKTGSAANEYVVMCGYDSAAYFTNAMKEYKIQGATQNGTYDAMKKVNVDVSQYEFNGVKLMLKTNNTLSNTGLTPFSGTRTATNFDYSKSMWFMPVGTDALGQPYVSKVTTQGGSTSKVEIDGTIDITGNPSKRPSNELDQVTVKYTSIVGMEVYNAPAHGYITAG